MKIYGNHKSGFTLVELLIAVMILAGSISGILLMYSASMASSELAWDTTVATSHAENILEEIQALDTLDAIVNRDWPAWITGEGLNTLPQENIEVMFANRASNPLDIRVNVQWTRKSRLGELALQTKITK